MMVCGWTPSDVTLSKYVLACNLNKVAKPGGPIID